MAFKFPLTPMSRRETNRIMDLVALKNAIENGGGGGGNVEFVFEEVEVSLSYSAQGSAYLSGTISVAKEGYKPIALAKCRPLDTDFALHSFYIDTDYDMLTVAASSLTNIMARAKVLTDATTITMSGSTATLNKVTVQPTISPVSASVIVVYVKNN